MILTWRSPHNIVESYAPTNSTTSFKSTLWRCSCFAGKRKYLPNTTLYFYFNWYLQQASGGNSSMFAYIWVLFTFRKNETASTQKVIDINKGHGFLNHLKTKNNNENQYPWLYLVVAWILYSRVTSSGTRIWQILCIKHSYRTFADWSNPQ